MRITKDYDTHTKDELLAEISARKIADINPATSKTDIVAALERDDAPKAPVPPHVAPPATLKSNIPQIPKVEPANIPAVPGQVPKDTEYGGSFVETSSGEPFALCVVKDDMAVDGKTHFAKNSVHFWNGTAEQFKMQFDKK